MTFTFTVTFAFTAVTLTPTLTLTFAFNIDIHIPGTHYQVTFITPKQKIDQIDHDLKIIDILTRRYEMFKICIVQIQPRKDMP